MRSFSFRINTNGNYTTTVKQWSTGANQHFWSGNVGTSSTFNIQGFKNIDVYGVDVIGSVTTLPNAATGGVIVNDWNLDVFINGNAPLIGSNITVTPNFYGINNTAVTNTEFPLGKYTSSVKLSDPIKSVQSIVLGDTYAQGIGWETAGSVNLFWNLNVIVYYKFEGE